MNVREFSEGIIVYLAEGESQDAIANNMISVNTEDNIVKPFYRNNENYSFQPLNEVVGFVDINPDVLNNEVGLTEVMAFILRGLNE